jgi:hypothetical protein
VANYVYWCMQITGEEAMVQNVIDRISAGLDDDWTAAGFDVPCVLTRDLWGEFMIGDPDEERWLWITPHSISEMAQKDGGDAYIRGVTKWAPPIDLAERITAIYSVTIDLTARTEHEFWENWRHSTGSSKRIGGGDFVRHELWEQPWKGDDPLAAEHHEVHQLRDDELERLRGATVVPKPLPPRQSFQPLES